MQQLEGDALETELDKVWAGPKEEREKLYLMAGMRHQSRRPVQERLSFEVGMHKGSTNPKWKELERSKSRHRVVPGLGSLGERLQAELATENA